MNDHKHKRSKTSLSDLWSKILESSYNEIYIFRADTLNFTQVSKGALNNLGYTMEEMRSLTPVDLKPEIDTAIFQTLIEPLLDGEKDVIVFETLHQRKDQSCYPVEIRLQYASGEAPPVFMAIINDLSGHKQSVETLTETHRMLQTVLDSIPVRVFWKDLDLTYLGCNHHFAMDAGLSGPEQIIGMNDFELAWGEQAGRYRADDTRVILSGLPRINYEEPQTRPDGEARILRTSKIPLRDAKGKVMGILGCYEDITEQKHAEAVIKESERRFQTLARVSPVGIFRTDADGHCVYVNERWCEMAGMTPEEALGEGWAMALHPEDRERVFNEWRSASAKQSPFKVECRFQRADGKVTWLLAQALAETSQDGATAGFIGTITDITERKRSEEAIRHIAAGVAAETGESFFQSLVIHLTKIFDVKYAVIGVIDEKTGAHIRTQAVCVSGEIADNLNYPLAGTPCQEVIAKGARAYLRDVQRLFPDDPMLVDLNVESYIAIALLDSKDHVMGLLLVMDNKPMQNSAWIQPILEIFAARASAELERVRIEESLRLSEERFSLAFRSSPEPIAICRLWDGMLIEVNQGFEEVFNVKRDEIIGKTIPELKLWKNPDDREKLLEIVRTEGRVRNFEATFRSRSGEDIIFLLSTELITIDGQECTVTIARDITEQKQAEQALEQARREWDQAMDYFEDAIVLISPDEKIIRANRMFYEMMRLTPEETIGRNPAHLFHPHGDKEGCPVYLARKEHRDTRIVQEADHPANRTGKPVEITTRVIRNQEGEAQSILVVTHDLSRRREIEDELKRHRDHLEEQVAERTAALRKQARIMDLINDSVVGTDLSGNITFWNRGAESMFGYRAEEVMGKSIALLYPRKKIRVNHSIVEHIKKSGIYVLETQLRRKSGSLFHAHISASADYDDKQQLIGIYTYTLDISEKKRMIEMLERDRAALESANQELKSFSYSVSHDLRSPLRAVDGFSQALQEDFADILPEEGRFYLQRIRRAAQHMGELIDNLLTISRVSQCTIQHRPVNLSDLVRKISREMMEQDISRNVTLKIQNEVIVKGDESLLQIALENLIGNAWKYTSRKPEACIEFGMRPLEGKPVLFVRDNGVGFNMEYADKLFVAFQRLHKPDEFEGTGIGLATVGRIIFRHGGEIWAEAKEGEGACFYFSLP